MNKPTAILIDDEPDIRELLAISLTRMGFDCHQAASFGEGQNLIKAIACDLCLTDVRMPDGSGIDLVKSFKKLYPKTPIAVMTAYDTTDVAIQALKAGAFDFLAKPIRAQRLEALVKDARSLLTADQPATAREFSGSLIGHSPVVKTLREAVEKASISMAPVLITGEPGTGKELVARSIHQLSQRKHGPFITVDCGAIPHELLESAFFGEKTERLSEAISDTPGFFQTASGGSLFLSELAELPVYFQMKLLRVLKERIVIPEGSDASEPVDVRLICASDKNLETEVISGSFREDLYYHINVISITTPALREHLEDLKSLSLHFLQSFSENTSIHLSSEAMEALKQHTYPRNVRELENILHRAAAMCTNNTISLADLNFSEVLASKELVDHSKGVVDPLEISDLEGYLNTLENDIIIAVLEAERWNRTRAAKRLGLTTRQFRYKLAKYQLNED